MPIDQFCTAIILANLIFIVRYLFYVFWSKFYRREKKAAVAFAYEDTQTVGGKPESDESEDDDDEFIEPEEFGYLQKIHFHIYFLFNVV